MENGPRANISLRLLKGCCAPPVTMVWQLRLHHTAPTVGVSGYCLKAPLTPSRSPSDIALLEADLSALFREFDGVES
jgi:hypothetical protein